MSLAHVRLEFGPDPLSLIGMPFVPPAAASTMVGRTYPDAGVLPISHVGCGNMWVLITTGVERGTVWNYQEGVEDYEPEALESPDYSDASTTEEIVEVNRRFVNALLADRSRRFMFWDWYQQWIDTNLQVATSS